VQILCTDLASHLSPPLTLWSDSYVLASAPAAAAAGPAGPSWSAWNLLLLLPAVLLLLSLSESSKEDSIPGIAPPSFLCLQVEKHRSKDAGVWFIRDGKVYDVTAFRQDHPGGEQVLLGLAGQDATDEFDRCG